MTVCFWDGLLSDKQRVLSRKAMSGSLRQNSPLSAMRTVAYIIESGQNCCEPCEWRCFADCCCDGEQTLHIISPLFVVFGMQCFSALDSEV